jgi:hypothetical protein
MRPNDLRCPLACTLISAGLSAVALVGCLSGTWIGMAASIFLFPQSFGVALMAVGAAIENANPITHPKSAACGAQE